MKNFPIKAVDLLAGGLHQSSFSIEEIVKLENLTDYHLIKELAHGRAEVKYKKSSLLPATPLRAMGGHLSLLILISKPGRLLDVLAEKGFNDEDITLLARINFQDLKAVINDKAEINVLGYSIDCNVRPRIPSKLLRIKEHPKMGEIRWNPNEFDLYMSPRQKTGPALWSEIENEIREAGKTMYNANPAIFLISHPWLIPNDWAQVNIFFPATKFICPSRRLYSYFLEKVGTKWDLQTSLLQRFGPKDRVAVITEKPENKKN